MCVDKEDFKSFKKEVFEVVGRVKHDTGNIRTGLDSVNKHLQTLNGRTKDLEHKMENLEDEEIREARCVQRRDVQEIRDTMLTAAEFKAYLERKARELKEEELLDVKRMEANQRRMQWVIAAIVGGGTMLMGILSFM